MGRFAWTCVVFLLSLLAASPAAHAERRVALVIGNGDYVKVGKLANPTRDARSIETLLRAAGFDVVEAKRDLGTVAMRRTLRDFSDRVRDADIAVVFYAGHGIEVNGTNYLIPVDATLERDIDVEDEAVPLERVTQVLEQAKRLRLVILDACRDNPFVRSMRRTIAGRSIGRGLAKIDVLTSDTLIAFAAKAGSTAADGEAANSPYTSALVKHLTTPGLDLRLALGRVRDEVLKSTGNKQEPFVYGSLGGTEIALVAKPRPPPALQGVPVSNLFTPEDLKRVVGLAAKKGLPLPAFRMYRPADDVGASNRQFVGIWMSDTGFRDTGRQWMTMIVGVNREGRAWGYHSRGPPMPNSVASPADIIAFTGSISGGTLTYSTSDAKIALSFTAQRRLQYREAWNEGPRSGKTAKVVLQPVWTLVEAERMAKKK
jgi:hypothetical protein